MCCSFVGTGICGVTKWICATQENELEQASVIIIYYLKHSVHKKWVIPLCEYFASGLILLEWFCNCIIAGGIWKNSHMGWCGLQEIFRPTSCPKQAQLCSQT